MTRGNKEKMKKESKKKQSGGTIILRTLWQHTKTEEKYYQKSLEKRNHNAQIK